MCCWPGKRCASSLIMNRITVTSQSKVGGLLLVLLPSGEVLLMVFYAEKDVE